MMYISSEKERCEILGTFLIESNGTVRSVAKKFGMSKSTVHKDITENLHRVNNDMWIKVKKILEKNKCERHLRGGEATRLKYLAEAADPCKR